MVEIATRLEPPIQARVSYVTQGNSLKDSAAYKAMSSSEKAAYNEGTRQALDAMNTACATGPYA